MQNFKSKLINFYKQTHNVLSPWEIPGGERFQILLKRNTSQDQDLKFITIIIFNRESKIMIQGSSGNIKCFVTDYFKDLDKDEITANGLVSTVDQPNEEETRILIKIEELNLNDKMNETEKSNDVMNENSGERLTTTSTTKPQQSDLSQSQTDTLNSNEEQNEIEDPVNVDASNVDIEDKPTEEMIQLVNNNQRDIFVEMNKYNEFQIHNLIDENEQIWGAINKQMEINEDIGKRFQNRLKLQRQIFEEMIEEQSNYFKPQLKAMNEELKQTKDIISDLKGQLRQVQKDINDNIKDPRHHSSKSVSSQTIANDKLNEKPTHLLTDNLINTQIVETKDDCVTDIPKSPVIAKSSNNICTHLCNLPESFDFSNALKSHPALKTKNRLKVTHFTPSVLKSSGSPAAKNYIEIKESHQQQQQQQRRQTTHITSTSLSNQTDKTYTAKQPILVLGYSMIKGIKEHLLNRQTYIKKVYISGATVKDFIEVVKNMNDPIPYAKILIHLGTNDIRNDNESTIIDNNDIINSTKMGNCHHHIFGNYLASKR